jgi:G3E family GTPase
VDDALIKLHSETQIIEMLNGCLCCTGAPCMLDRVAAEMTCLIPFAAWSLFVPT